LAPASLFIERRSDASLTSTLLTISDQPCVARSDGGSASVEPATRHGKLPPLTPRRGSWQATPLALALRFDSAERPPTASSRAPPLALAALVVERGAGAGLAGRCEGVVLRVLGGRRRSWRADGANGCCWRSVHAQQPRMEHDGRRMFSD